MASSSEIFRANIDEKEKEYISNRVTKQYREAAYKKPKTSKTIYQISQTFFYPADAGAPEGLRRPRTSWNLVTWVICHSALPHTAKLVAAQIASHYNAKTREIFPSMDTLVEETGLNKNTIVNAVKLMQQSGEWEVNKVSPEGSQKTIFFYIPRSPETEDINEGNRWVSSHRQQEYKDFLDNKEKQRNHRQRLTKKRLEDEGVDSLNQVSKNTKSTDEYKETVQAPF